MLVLSRKEGEVVLIGNDIQVMVVNIRGDKVRLGINAPQHVSVHRKEVFERILKEGSRRKETKEKEEEKKV